MGEMTLSVPLDICSLKYLTYEYPSTRLHLFWAKTDSASNRVISSAFMTNLTLDFNESL